MNNGPIYFTDLKKKLTNALKEKGINGVKESLRDINLVYHLGDQIPSDIAAFLWACEIRDVELM